MEVVTEIPLVNGLVALVDDEDAEKVQGIQWFAHHDRRNIYAQTHTQDVPTGKRRTISMHRVIMGAQPGEQIDHVNGNGLDNRRANMRFCTHAENQHNGRKRIDNTSGYKGVYWDKSSCKWRAQIKVNTRRFFLGRFASETDAACAYNDAALEQFGEFACLNDVTPALAALAGETVEQQA